MPSDPSTPGPRADAAGVRLVEASAVRRAAQLLLLGAALICLVATGAIVVIRLPHPAAQSAPAGGVPDLAATRPSPDPSRPPAASRAKALRITRPAPAPPPAAGRPALEAKDVIPGLIASGETGGIAVFPLPGTKPVKRGIVVPEDFALPEGYVRHYQMTDDGRQLPPILMFHPDYQFVDERGAPVPLPEDRVVPPDMAPAGLPIRMLEPGATDPAP
jgi:hypothetical protein